MTANSDIGKVMRNLNREIDKIEGRTLAGLMAGGLLIQRRSQKKTPREHGFLVNSAYTRRVPFSRTPAVEVGYTSAYAVFVHENMEQKLKGQPRPSGLGEYWGPAGEPKFLERATIESTDEVLALVASYAEVRP